MRKNKMNQPKITLKKLSTKLRLFILILAVLVISQITPRSQAQTNIELTVNADGKNLAAGEKIEIRLKEPLKPEQGTLALMVNQTDVTAFVSPNSNLYSYIPKIFPLPLGENRLRIYLVNPKGEWNLIREITFQVIANLQPKKDSPGNISHEKMEIEWTPNLSLNFKGESNILFSPNTARPPRLSFLDTAGQGNIQLSVKKKGWTVSSQFDMAGSSLKQEALRFGEIGIKAPNIDLSSYLVQIEKGRFKAQLGHISFGSQRHLVKDFQSRGLLVTVPVGKQNDVTFTLLNGTSIVGFDNFTGTSRSNHQVFAATFAREFYKERPGALRLELSVMHGSVLPLNGFNDRSINDAEKSFGGTIRLQFKDKSERLRFEGGFTRNRFTNPSDPLLEQGQTVTPIQSVSRNARFIEVSFDILKNKKVWRERKLTLTGTFRHEEIEPLFRSVVAFNQADRRQNQFEIRGNLGEIGFTFGNLRDRDNLSEIATILKTLGRRNNVFFSVPLNTLWTPSKPVKWLPRLGYNLTQVRQFGAFLPQNGDFRELSQVPDQQNYSQNFNAEWSLFNSLRIGYRYSLSFQDNRQPGREKSDFLNLNNGVNIGYSGIKNVQLNFDLSRESAKNFEQPRINDNLRIASNIIWRDALLKNLTFNTNLSAAIAGDRTKLFDSRNIEYDAQIAYRFEVGSNKFKRLNAQIFVRYANSYGHRIDRQFSLNNFNKRQRFNMGLNFSFF